MRVIDAEGGFFPDWIRATIQLIGPHGPFSGLSGGGGGSGFRGVGDPEYDASFAFEAIPSLTIAYMHDGVIVDEEQLNVRRA